MKTLQKISKNDLAEFVDTCHTMFGVDKELFTNEVISIYNWHRKNGQPLLTKELQEKWYSSVNSGAPDFSVYDDIYYLCDTWACWKIYSRNYLRSLLISPAFAELSHVKSIIDVGCGIGYTTNALTEMFPDADVFCTNLENTMQWDLCKHYGLNIFNDSKVLGITDMIVAFEYFEHFQDPISHLRYLVETNNPEFFLIANSFGTTSVGHFIEQDYKGSKAPSKRFGRLFNKELRELGYIRIKTGIFNDKPSLWKRLSRQTYIF